MFSTGRRLVCAAAVILLISVVSCNVEISPPGDDGTASVAVTVAGKTFTFTFGPAVEVEVTANETKPPAAVGFRLFDTPPEDTPAGGAMILRSTDVGVGQLLTAKDIVRSQAQALNGTATVQFSIASGQSAALCDSATFLAEYELTLTGGALSIAQEVYELSQEALAVVQTNDVTVCISVTADFSGVITFSSFNLTFDGGDPDTASIRMWNDDSENIHIMTPGETFDISNRISPGGARDATVEGVTAGETINIRAGRNGEVLDTIDCPMVTGTNYTATVVWNGSSLSCDAAQGASAGPIVFPGGTMLQVPINSMGEAVSPTATYGGVDYAVVGVLDVNSSTQYPPNLPSNISTSLARVDVDLAELGLAYVEEIYFTSHAAWIPDLPNGVTIATLTCDYVQGGTSTTQDMTTGSTTAEWSYDRPDHDILIGGVPHSIIPILYSFDTVSEMGYDYEGHIYKGHLTLDSSRTLSSISLQLVDPQTYIDLRNPDAGGPITWAGQASGALTLVGPAGTPGGGGGGGGGTGTVTGQVVNARTGEALAGVTVQVSGTALSTTTDASGNFTITGISEGGQVLQVMADGFVETSVPVAVLPSATVETSIGMVEATFGGTGVAAILSWGEQPKDLDFHMSGPDGAGGRFHIYYYSRSPVEFAFLDLDDTDSFGPETITVSPRTDGSYVAGDYHLWVHHFAGDLTLGQSSATVTLFAAGAQLAQYSVGGASGDDTKKIWRVLEFTLDAEGAISNLRSLQTFDDGDDDSVF